MEDFNFKNYLGENKLNEQVSYFNEEGEPNVEIIQNFLLNSFPDMEEEVSNYINNHDEGLDILLTNISLDMDVFEVEETLKEDFEQYAGIEPSTDLEISPIEEVIDDGEDSNSPPWVSTYGDGWNEDFMEDIGLMEVLANFSKISYEIKNAVRGTLGVSGDTLEDLQQELIGLKSSLEQIIDSLEDYF